jgi:hypothetical protein
VTCAPENVPHRQRLREIRKFWPGIRVAGVHPRSGEEIARWAAQMNSNGSVYALSCIGRWVAYSILRWSLSAIGYSLRARLYAISPKRQRRHCFRLRTIAEAHCLCDRHESSHPIHKVKVASPNFQPRCSYQCPPRALSTSTKRPTCVECDRGSIPVIFPQTPASCELHPLASAADVFSR